MVLSDRETGRPKGFGFVEMASRAEAKLALQRMDGVMIGGRALRVAPAKPKQQRNDEPGRDREHGPRDRSRSHRKQRESRW